MPAATLVLATLLLMASPGLIRRFASTWRPSQAAMIHSTSLVSGYVTLEAGLLVCAAPLLAGWLHARPSGPLGLDHFFPGGRVAGYIALGLAVAIPSVIVFEVVRSGIRRRRAAEAVLMTWSEPNREDTPIVVLPGDQAEAVAIPGRHPVVVLSTGMFANLSHDELRLVVRHELTHIRSHSYFLIMIGAMEPLARLIPFLRRSLDTLRLALERWADESAAQTATDRSRMQGLLGKLALHGLIDQPEERAATLVESRVYGLAAPAPARTPGVVVGLLALSALVTTGAMSVVMWLTGSLPWL
jgi:hypothetical protein